MINKSINQIKSFKRIIVDDHRAFDSKVTQLLGQKYNLANEIEAEFPKKIRKLIENM